MVETSHIHATAIVLVANRRVAGIAVSRALPLLALVDAHGLECHPHDILMQDATAPRHATAYRVLDISHLGPSHTRVVVVHEGPGSVERAQGYVDILSELWPDPQMTVTFKVHFGAEQQDFPLASTEEIRERALVRWAREGLPERPASHSPSALVLLPTPPPDQNSREMVTSTAEDRLRRGAVGYDFGGLTPTAIPASTAADHLTVLQYLPYLNTGLGGVHFVSNDVEETMGLIDAPSLPLAKSAPHLLTQINATSVTSLTAPTGFGGPIAERVAPTPATAQRHRKGKAGRLIYMDASALMAGMDKDWFHPDDQVFTCIITAFHTAGSVTLTQEGDYRRESWAVISDGFLRPIPVSTGMIYDYGARILAMREAKYAVHPEATRYELWAAIVAKQHNAILATCLPERYKGLLRGLEFTHYQPLGNGWASRLGWDTEKDS